MLEKTGVPTEADIESVFPTQERLEQGPVAVIECYQRIPCNPCFTACKRDAIQPFLDINDCPTINRANCNGCALCLAKCPGLAIMVVDDTWSEDRALIKIPYEFRPLPTEGQMVMGLDRAGNPVEPVEIIKVLDTPMLDHTPIISFAVSKDKIKIIRNIGGVK